jgi:plastocyanin
MKQIFGCKLCALCIGIFLAARPAAAAIHNVTVNESTFSPALLTINVGDTVVWENVDEFFFHTTTSDLAASDPNYWAGIMVDQGDTFDHVFGAAGTFTYHDQFGSGHGSIIVQSVAVPPEITLNSARLDGGQFVFDVSGLSVGKTNVLQASTNLASWVPVKTNVAASSSMTLTNAIVLPRRFYRLSEQP